MNSLVLSRRLDTIVTCLFLSQRRGKPISLTRLNSVLPDCVFVTPVDKGATQRKQGRRATQQLEFTAPNFDYVYKFIICCTVFGLQPNIPLFRAVGNEAGGSYLVPVKLVSAQGIRFCNYLIRPLDLRVEVLGERFVLLAKFQYRYEPCHGNAQLLPALHERLNSSA